MDKQLNFKGTFLKAFLLRMHIDQLFTFWKGWEKFLHIGAYFIIIIFVCVAMLEETLQAKTDSACAWKVWMEQNTVFYIL